MLINNTLPLLEASSLIYDTVQSCYHAVNFLQNPHNIHPIAYPSGWAMGCLLWVQALTHVLPQTMEWYIQYHVLLDRIIMAFDYLKPMTLMELLTKVMKFENVQKLFYSLETTAISHTVTHFPCLLQVYVGRHLARMLNGCDLQLFNSLRPNDAYICVGNLTIIGSDNGLSPGRRQAFI